MRESPLSSRPRQLGGEDTSNDVSQGFLPEEKVRDPWIGMTGWTFYQHKEFLYLWPHLAD